MREYKHVVLAVHAHQALCLLGDGATELEYTILDTFKTSQNICYLHSDESVSVPFRNESAIYLINMCILASPKEAICPCIMELPPPPSAIYQC